MLNFLTLLRETFVLQLIRFRSFALLAAFLPAVGSYGQSTPWPDQYLVDYTNSTQLIESDIANGLGHTGLTSTGDPVRVAILDTPIRFNQPDFDMCTKPSGADPVVGWEPNGADCPVAWIQCIPIPGWTPPPGSGWPLCHYNQPFAPSTDPHGENVARGILSVAPDAEIVSLRAWNLKDALDWLLAPNPAFGSVTPVEHFNIVAVNYSAVISPRTIPDHLLGPLDEGEVVFIENFTQEMIENLRGKFWATACSNAAIDSWYASQVAEGRTWVPLRSFPTIEQVKLEDEVAALRAAGALLVNAAGNERALRNGTHFPGCIPGVTNVGVIPENYLDVQPPLTVDRTDHPTLVDIVAPSGFETVTSQVSDATSFSTPMVSGAVALLKASVLPTSPVTAIEQMLVEHGMPVLDARWERCDRVYETYASSGELVYDERGYLIPLMNGGNYVYSSDDLRGTEYCTNDNYPYPSYIKRRLSLMDTINGTVFASLDIAPADPLNEIDPSSTGQIDVAVLSTTLAAGELANFDATTVNPATVAFGPGLAPSAAPPTTQDIDGDLDVDMVLTFDVQATGISCTDVNAELIGQTTGGNPIVSEDSIVATNCGSQGCH